MQKNILKVYCTPLLPNVSWIPILDFVFGERVTNNLFQNIDPTSYKDIFTIVDNPTDADYFLIPHMYARLKREPSYLERCVDLSKKYSKTLLLFAYQDGAEKIDIPNTIIFRPSQYKKTLALNEIIMPAFVEDLGVLYGISLKEKTATPSVGFVGKADFENFQHHLRFLYKNTILKRGPLKDGLYFRREAMRILSGDHRIKSNFITRSSYSGNKKSITLDPVLARKEYIHNMQENDFTLAPKGDGNYSLRFYETLSMSRIPILVDTDMVLPLEDKIPYDDIIIRIDYKNIRSITDTIVNLYKNWSSNEYEDRQKKARIIFEKYLFMPAFIKEVFNNETLSRYKPQS